jgi:hypothetical protein
MKPSENRMLAGDPVRSPNSFTKVVQTPRKFSWPLVLVGALPPPVDRDGEPGSTRKAANYTTAAARLGKHRGLYTPHAQAGTRASTCAQRVAVDLARRRSWVAAATGGRGIVPRSALLVTRRAYVDQHLSLAKPATEGAITDRYATPRLGSVDVPCKHGEHARCRPGLTRDHRFPERPASRGFAPRGPRPALDSSSPTPTAGGGGAGQPLPAAGGGSEGVPCFLPAAWRNTSRTRAHAESRTEFLAHHVSFDSSLGLKGGERQTRQKGKTKTMHLPFLFVGFNKKKRREVAMPLPLLLRAKK